MSELVGRFGDGLALLLRRWWFVLGCGLLAAGLGYLWSETVAADDGEATSRVGFGPDPEYFDILPNIDRITAYVESDEFRSALGSDDITVEAKPPNGILAFLDLEASGASTDAEAVAAANEAAVLVASHMNSIFGVAEQETRDALNAQLAEVDANLPGLEAERDRLAAIQAETIVLRLEDEAAFARYVAAQDERDTLRIQIEGLVRQRSEAQLDLAGLDRRRPDGAFEVLREATLDNVTDDRPVWPLAGAVGLALGALVVVARDRDLLPIRESADLAELRLGDDVLLIDGSVRSVALLLRRKAALGERVLIAGLGVPTTAIANRIEGLLTTLETPTEVIAGGDSKRRNDVVSLIDGGEVGTSVAEEAVHADGAVLLVGSGRVQPEDLEGPLAELSALGVDVHAVLVTDPAAAEA